MKQAPHDLTALQQRYQALVAAQTEENHATMRASLAATDLSEIPTLPQPHWLTHATRARLHTLSEHLSSAYEKATLAYFSGAIEPSWVPMHPHAQQLAREDLGILPIMFCARFDTFFYPETGQIAIMECNAGDPSGAGYVDAFLKMLATLPAMQTLQQEHTLDSDWLLASHRQAVLKAYDTLCPPARHRNAPRIVQLSDPEAFVHQDHLTIAAHYRERGSDFDVVDPRTLSYDGSSLYAHGREVDIVLRDTIDEIVLPPFWASVQPILQAYEHKHVQLFNHFCTVAADYKSLLELLSDPSYAPMYSEAENQTLREVIPWTRLVQDTTTTFEGRTIDLLPFVRDHREELVLKPNEGYGGFGIKIGPETSPKNWEDALQEAVQTPCSTIVQRYLPPPKEAFLSFREDGTLDLQEKKVTLSFWVHNNTFAGCFSRVSDDSIINVHQGGGLIPIVFA